RSALRHGGVCPPARSRRHHAAGGLDRPIVRAREHLPLRLRQRCTQLRHRRRAAHPLAGFARQPRAAGDRCRRARLSRAALLAAAPDAARSGHARHGRQRLARRRARHRPDTRHAHHLGHHRRADRACRRSRRARSCHRSAAGVELPDQHVRGRDPGRPRQRARRRRRCPHHRRGGGGGHAGAAHQLPAGDRLPGDRPPPSLPPAWAVRPEGDPELTAYLVAILTLVAIATLVGFGLNIQWGLCGLVNFGIVGFFSLGAYVAALVGLSGAGAFAGMAAAALACACASALLALLAARLEDDYLAIVTIGFGEIVRLVMLNEDWLTHGALGLADIPRPFEHMVAADTYPVAFLAFAVALVAAVFAILEALTRSPFGRALRAVRDDDVVTATLGKSPFVLRVKAFAIGGAVMGLAGSLHAFYLTYIDPSQFTPIVTAYAFMAVIAGGRGSNVGLLLGAGSIMLLIEATRFLKDFIPFLDATK